MSNYSNVIWRPFEEAREFARSLQLNGQREWTEYCKDPEFPSDIRRKPTPYVGWVSWADWLGTNNIFNRIVVYRPFEEAREFVRSLNLKDTNDWIQYKKSPDFPDDIRRHPFTYEEWQGMSDWLGNIKHSTIIKTKIRYCSFKEAREYARSLGLKHAFAWSQYTQNRNFPKNIRKVPTYYDEWVSWDNWLTYDSNDKIKIFISFEESRLFARSLGLNNMAEWIEYVKRDDFPENIRKLPQVYDGWVDWKDWLGSKRSVLRRKKSKKEKWLPFEEAREYARTLGLKSQVEWHEYILIATDFPEGIRRSPNQYVEWISWFDWLDK